MSGLFLETCLSNLKSVALTVLDLLASNVQKFRRSRVYGFANLFFVKYDEKIWGSWWRWWKNLWTNNKILNLCKLGKVNVIKITAEVNNLRVGYDISAMHDSCNHTPTSRYMTACMICQWAVVHLPPYPSPLQTRKPSWRKGKRATAVRVWRPLTKKSTANLQLMVNSNRGRITYGLRIAGYFRV